MKKYKTYTAKKLKLPRRLLFFFAVAAIIFAATVFVGNILKNRVETVKENSDTTFTLETEKAQMDTVMQTAKHDSALSAVCAGHLATEGITDAKGVREKISQLKAGGYNAVSFAVNSDTGEFTYASPALQEISRLPASEKLFSYALLKEAASAAKALGMRMSAVMCSSADTDIDSAVAAELYSAGFDEIIVTGFESDAPDDSTVSRINSYVEALRKSAPVDFGVLLSDDVLSDSKNAPFIEKIFAKTEFLAIDMRNADSEKASSLAENIQGSFSAYLLRPLLRGDNAESAATVRAALTGASINACQYISSPEKPAEETTANATEG